MKSWEKRVGELFPEKKNGQNKEEQVVVCKISDWTRDQVTANKIRGVTFH